MVKAPVNGEENLIPMNKRTKEEQRRIAAMGGKASGEARRRKRDAKSAARLILNLPATETIEKNLKALGIEDEEDFTNMVAMMVRAFTKAMQGDISAMQFLINMSGTSPQFKMEEERHKRDIQKEEKASDAVNDWINAVMQADKEKPEEPSDGKE